MMSKRARSIRLTLDEGDPDGVRSVTLVGRSTSVLCGPLSSISVLKEREEGKRPAVYFLFGEIDGTDCIYIGECDSLSDRFRGKHHALEKADWQQIAVASTTDETFNKAHARRAEHLLVEIARDLNRVKVLTDQTSQGRLSAGDAAFVEEFAEDVALLSEILGIRVFRGGRVRYIESVPPVITHIAALPVAENVEMDTSGPDIFKFTGARDVKARMRGDGAGYLLLAGSEARKDEGTACPPAIQSQRAKAKSAKVLVAHPYKPDFLIFSKDYWVKSTSAAAGMLTGTSLRGPHCWEHEIKGLRYDVWIENQQKSSGAL